MDTESGDSTRTGARRRWWLAALLSYALPGLGQVYNGQADRGIRFLSAALITAMLMVISVTAGGAAVTFGLILLLALVITLLACVVDAARSARHQPEPFPCRSYNRWYIYLVAVVVSSFAMASVRHVYVQTFYIPSGAMEGTLLVGDYLLADMRHDDPGVGEVLIYESIEEPARMLIKRCVASGGQTVEIRDKVLYVDGEMVADPPLSKHVDSVIYRAGSRVRDNFGPYTVPEDHFFMMGDNRDRSRDSRHTGAVPLQKMKGKAVVIYWSSSPKPGPFLGGMPQPILNIANFVWHLPTLPWRSRYGRVGQGIE